MEKTELIERAKKYLRMLGDGVHPVTGKPLPEDSCVTDEKVKRCFAFITEVLDEYTVLKERVEMLEKEKENGFATKKEAFSITPEQCETIKLSKEPISVWSFMKNINSVIDTDRVERLSSTRLNKWLTGLGLVKPEKMQTLISKTVYKPSDVAVKIGIVEEVNIDKKSGEVKTQIKLTESAQLFIIENLSEIARQE